MDQLLKRPEDIAPTRSSTFEYQPVPLDVPPYMNKPCEIASDSTGPFTLLTGLKTSYQLLRAWPWMTVDIKVEQTLHNNEPF